MSQMTTLSEVLNILKADGYSVDFNLNDNCLVCHGNALQVYPEDFVVDRHYRFEGDTDPGDAAILYAISSQKHGIKGTLVNGYGLYSDPMSSEMVKTLHDKSSTAHPLPTQKQNETSITSKTITLEDAIVKLNSNLDKNVNTISLHKTPGMSIMLVALNADAELKKHTAPGPISVQVIAGSISFRTDDDAHDLTAGMLLTLESKIPHSVYAHDRSMFLVTISTPQN